jgi:hypothetical protein
MLACDARSALLRRTLLLGAVYCATVIAVAAAFAYKLVPAPLAIPVALLPLVPAAFIPLVMLEKIRAMDELQRKIQLEAMAFAFALTAVLSLAYGFLELFANFPEVNWVWVWPLLGACQAAGIVMGRRRYR